MTPDMETASLAVREREQESFIFLGKVITCNTCQAYLDGFVRASKTGFCPVCGVHMPTMKRRQERKARLIRHYEDGEVI